MSQILKILGWIGSGIVVLALMGYSIFMFLAGVRIFALAFILGLVLIYYLNKQYYVLKESIDYD